MIYVILADGFEEVEALVPVDMMRRCGLNVKTAGLFGIDVCGAHSVTVKADMLVDDINFDEIDGIVLPGGMPGTQHLKESESVKKLIEYCMESKLMIGAICAAPSVLGELGYLDGADAVCYPGFEEALKGAKVHTVPVVRSGNIITSRGAGTAFEFGRAIIDYLDKGRCNGKSVLSDMMYPYA